MVVATVSTHVQIMVVMVVMMVIGLFLAMLIKGGALLNARVVTLPLHFGVGRESEYTLHEFPTQRTVSSF